MDSLHDLRKMLCNELDEYGKKKEVTAGNLEVIDKLTHAIKNLDKIIEAEEDGYSNRYYDDRMSYARGRRYARRDSRGRYSGEDYSRADGMIDRLYDVMEDAPDERIRQEMQRMISRIETRM